MCPNPLQMALTWSDVIWPLKQHKMFFLAVWMYLDDNHQWAIAADWFTGKEISYILDVEFWGHIYTKISVYIVRKTDNDMVKLWLYLYIYIYICITVPEF